MTGKELNSIVKDTLFNQSIESSMSFVAYTGRGGVKEYVKAFITKFKLPYTLINFIRTYKWLISTGAIIKNTNGGYLIK